MILGLRLHRHIVEANNHALISVLANRDLNCYNWLRPFQRNLSHTTNKHPVLTPLAKAAGVKANHLRNNAETITQVELSHTCSMETILSHAGLPSDDSHNSNSPLTPPIHLSSTYMRPASGDYGSEGLVYTRTHNPTRLLFEQTMAQIETLQTNTLTDGYDPSATATSIAFSSGMAAVSAILMAAPSPIHVILPEDVYWGVPNLLSTVFQNQSTNIRSYSTVDMTYVDQLEKNIMELLQKQQGSLKTIIVWIETPSNPKCQVIDIYKVCQRIHTIQESHPWIEIQTVVDSTLAPPNITQPLLVSSTI